MSNPVPQVYSWIIQDVVDKMGRKFAELGLDENVLTDIKQIWEAKIRNMGVAPFAPTAIQPNYQGQFIQYPTQGGEVGFQDGTLPFGVNGYFPSIPQEDGINESNECNEQNSKISRLELDRILLQAKIPQLDGRDDDEDDEEDDDQDSDIGSELDDEEEDENVKTDHLILCQYEKVSRIKNKWKCILKDGVVNINGKDFVFNRVRFRDLYRQMVTLNGKQLFQQ